MNKKLTITTTEEIFRIRNFLQQISHISFTFSNVNKRYPIESLTEEQGQEVLQVYRNLLKDTQAILETYFNNLNLNQNDKPRVDKSTP
jgi:hypothetical protein